VIDVHVVHVHARRRRRQQNLWRRRRRTRWLAYMVVALVRFTMVGLGARLAWFATRAFILNADGITDAIFVIPQDVKLHRFTKCVVKAVCAVMCNARSCASIPGLAVGRTIARLAWLALGALILAAHPAKAVPIPALPSCICAMTPRSDLWDASVILASEFVSTIILTVARVAFTARSALMLAAHRTLAIRLIIAHLAISARGALMPAALAVPLSRCAKAVPIPALPRCICAMTPRF